VNGLGLVISVVTGVFNSVTTRVIVILDGNRIFISSWQVGILGLTSIWIGHGGFLPRQGLSVQISKCWRRLTKTLVLVAC
jgi:hypothetical protein